MVGWKYLEGNDCCLFDIIYRHMSGGRATTTGVPQKTFELDTFRIYV
jgi:hypothetical protein